MKSTIGTTGFQLSFLPWLGHFLSFVGGGG